MEPSRFDQATKLMARGSGGRRQALGILSTAALGAVMAPVDGAAKKAKGTPGM